MGKFLKIAIFCMAAAVLLLPAALLLRGVSENLTLAVLILSMILELIGLVFVVISILKRRKETNNYDKTSETN